MESRFFLVGAAERQAHVIIPALGHEADRVGVRLQEASKAADRWKPRPLPAFGHAKATKDAFRVRFFSKKLGVGRVGARIAALDIIDAEGVKHAGNGDLVLDGKNRCRAVCAPSRSVVSKR